MSSCQGKCSTQINFEGGLAGHWYPIGYSHKLKKIKKPKRFFLLGKPFVLWKSNNKWVVNYDICPHRHASFSEGKVVKGHLRCPYHGWSFDDSGDLVDIPGLDKKFLKSTKLESFLVKDDGLLFWVCLDRETTNKALDVFSPQEAKKTLKASKVFDSAVEDVIENFMDSPHTLFVHNGLIRCESQTVKRKVTVKTVADGVRVLHHSTQEKIGLAGRFVNPKAKAVSHEDRFLLPSHLTVTYSYEGEVKPFFKVLIALRPIHEKRTAIYVNILLDLGWKATLLKPFLALFAQIILWQDRKVLTQQIQNRKYLDKVDYDSSLLDYADRQVRKKRRACELKITHSKDSEKSFEFCL